MRFRVLPMMAAAVYCFLPAGCGGRTETDSLKRQLEKAGTENALLARRVAEREAALRAADAEVRRLTGDITEIRCRLAAIEVEFEAVRATASDAASANEKLKADLSSSRKEAETLQADSDRLRRELYFAWTEVMVRYTSGHGGPYYKLDEEIRRVARTGKVEVDATAAAALSDQGMEIKSLKEKVKAIEDENSALRKQLDKPQTGNARTGNR